jgi:hypothetical protein
MNPTLKNILAVVAGLIAGSVVNGGIIAVSGSLIPPPAGADVSTMEGLKASMHLFGPEHFLMPFLAHALGTLVGAFIAAKITANNHTRFALVIGVVFFIGGSINVALLSAPMWFNVLDLVAAYLPMAYLGAKLAERV